MQEIVQTLGTPRMIVALEATLQEEMMCFGYALAGGEIYNDGEIEGFYTGRRHLNGILRTHFKQATDEYVQERIKRVLRYFQERGVTSPAWSLGRDTQPVNMAWHLEQCGFNEFREENIGMAIDVHHISAERIAVEGLEIREVEQKQELYAMKQLEMEGFGSDEELAQNYYEMYVGCGFGPGTRWRHFSGWVDGTLVASAALLFHAGVAGIFNVATLSQFRRRGIARAMVLHTLEYARREGYRIAILSPTDMSEGIYTRIGFRRYTEIRHYIRQESEER